MASAGKPSNPAFEAAVRDCFARQALLGTLGAWLVDVAPGTVTVEVPYNKRLVQQQGLFHGGVASTLVEAATSLAALSLMPALSDVSTVEYKINFTRPAAGQLMRATGTVLRAGRTLSVARAEILCGSPDALEVAAIAQATLLRVDIA